MAIQARVIEVTEPARAGARRDEAPSRHALWETVADGLEALVDDAPAGTAETSGAGEACAARVGTWLRARAHLAEGDSVDRALVEAVIEAASTRLVYAGKDAGRVDVARHRFEDRSLGSLAPSDGPLATSR